MKKRVLAILICLMFVSLSVSFAEEENDTYGDFLRDLELISGDENGDLKEDDPITREEFITMLSKLVLPLEIPELPTKPTFSDVSVDRWSYKYVEFAYALDITSGTGNGKFSPNANITYDQVCYFLIKNIGYEENYSNIRQIAKDKYRIYSVDGAAAPVLKRKHVFELVARSLYVINPGKGHSALTLNINKFDKFNINNDLVNFIIEEDLKRDRTTLETKKELLPFELKDVNREWLTKEDVSLYEALTNSGVNFTEIEDKEFFDSIRYNENNLGIDGTVIHAYGYYDLKEPIVDGLPVYEVEDASYQIVLNRFYDKPDVFFSDLYDLEVTMFTHKEICKGESFRLDNEEITPYILNFIGYDWNNVLGNHIPIQLILYVDENDKPIRWHFIAENYFLAYKGDGEYYRKGSVKNVLKQPVDENGFVIRTEAGAKEEQTDRFGFSDSFRDKYSDYISESKNGSDVIFEKIKFIQEDVDYPEEFGWEVEFEVAVNYEDGDYGFTISGVMLTDRGKNILLETIDELDLYDYDKKALIDFINGNLDSSYLSEGYKRGDFTSYNFVGVPSQYKIFDFKIINNDF